MSKLYLVTGFLGAGKTTFLKNFIRLFPNERIHLIVNEFGKEGIDGQLLKEVGTVLDEINNGSIFCSCRLDMFETVLEKALKKEPDVIIIEASGLSNPTNIRKILDQPGRFENLDYKGGICIVDAARFMKVYKTATVVKKQVSVSDLLIINKTDLVDREQIQQVENTIRQYRPDMQIYETTYGQVNEAWIIDMRGQKPADQQGKMQAKDITLRSYELVIKDNSFTLYDFGKFLEMFLEDTYRVKGFVCLEDTVYLVDCVGPLLKIRPYHSQPDGVNCLVILAGNGLPVKKSVEKAMEWYPEKVAQFART